MHKLLLDKMEVKDLAKKLKMMLLAFICLLLVVISAGCSSNEPFIEASRTNQIPEDGVIEKEVFINIKANDDIGIFNGTSNNINYQWLFIGSEISDPKDENLQVNFSNARTGSVRALMGTDYVQEFSFQTTEEISGNPTLTLYFPIPWEVEAVVLYRYEDDEVIGVAAVENLPNAIVTFAPIEFRGLFYLVGISNIEDFAGEVAAGVDLSAFLSNSTSENQDSESPLNLQGSSNESNRNTIGDWPSEANRPQPVNPENQVVNENFTLTATLTIRADTLLNNMDLLDASKHFLVPADGIIMATQTVEFSEGESVFDVLLRETRAARIHMEFRQTPGFNSAYVAGIHNLYEFDAGPLSGWVYKVNGWAPNFGSSRYILQQGDVIEWLYTVDLGRDVGADISGQSP